MTTSKAGYLHVPFNPKCDTNTDRYAPIKTWDAGMKASDWLIHNTEMLLSPPHTADVSYLVKRFGLGTAQDALRMNTGKWVVIRQSKLNGEVWIAEVKEDWRPKDAA